MSYALRAVRRATMLRAFYKHLRDWLTFTELDRYRSGRVLEYMWPVLFGEPAVQEPVEARQLACGEAAWCSLYLYVIWSCVRCALRAALRAALVGHGPGWAGPAGVGP